MDIELHFKITDDVTDIKKYSYKNIEQAAYFMGLLQQGIRFNAEMYIMEDHFLDVNDNIVIVSCITMKEAEKKVAAQMNNQASPEFMSRLGPAFRTNDGGDDGGVLN